MAVPTLPVDDLARESAPVTGRRKIYPWVVFALAFGLLLSDYMSRQVLNAVFPLLKREWALTDAKLATLSSVVALMVGLLTFPLSLLADRWGRVKSLVLMAVIADQTDKPYVGASNCLYPSNEKVWAPLGMKYKYGLPPEDVADMDNPEDMKAPAADVRANARERAEEKGWTFLE